jgi:hypothetical protein
MLPSVATAVIQELLLRPMVEANPSDATPELSFFTRALISFALANMRFMGWTFLIGPVVIAFVAVVNRRAGRDGDGGSDRWLWSVLCAVFFVGSVSVAMFAFRRSGDVALLLYWMSLVAGAIALGEAFMTQKTRREAGRSRWSPSFVVFIGVVSSLFHPIPLALVSIGPQLLWWKDRRAATQRTA